MPTLQLSPLSRAQVAAAEGFDVEQFLAAVAAANAQPLASRPVPNLAAQLAPLLTDSHTLGAVARFATDLARVAKVKRLRPLLLAQALTRLSRWNCVSGHCTFSTT